MTDSREQALNALDEVIAELAKKQAGQRRRNGWTPQVTSDQRAFFEAMKNRIERRGPPHPRELPDQAEVFRGLDALGVDVFASDSLVEAVMDAYGLLRRYADEVARSTRPRGS